MAAMPQTGQAQPAAPMTRADLETAIAALPGRKQRLRETFDRLVACAPLHVQLPFTWDDIDAHVSSLHASFSLRFRQMQQQRLPSVPVSVSGSAIHDDEQPHPGAPVSPTATPDGEQPHPGVPVSPTATRHSEQPNSGVPVSATHDDESIKEEWRTRR
uniref:Uncharacterized protein n=1 Tax=Aegilops tauschii TaxID=37682 RepID=N1R0Y4_AEGTA